MAENSNPTVVIPGFTPPPASAPAAAPASAPEGSGNPHQVKVPQLSQEQRANTPEANIQAILERALNQSKPDPTTPPATEAQPTPPQEPAKDEPKVPDAKIEDFGLDPETRDLGKLMLAVLPKLDISRVLDRALDHGDASLIDEHYIREASPDKATAERLMTVAKQIIAVTEAKSNAMEASVYAEAGGKDQFNVALGVFNQSAPAHLKQAAAALLNSKTSDGVKSGARLIAEFAKQSGQVPVKGERVSAGQAAPNQGQGLSQAEFKKAVAQVLPEQRNPQYNEQMKALFEARRLGKATGRQ